MVSFHVILRVFLLLCDAIWNANLVLYKQNNRLFVTGNVITESVCQWGHHQITPALFTSASFYITTLCSTATENLRNFFDIQCFITKLLGEPEIFSGCKGKVFSMSWTEMKQRVWWCRCLFSYFRPVTKHLGRYQLLSRFLDKCILYPYNKTTFKHTINRSDEILILRFTRSSGKNSVTY